MMVDQVDFLKEKLKDLNLNISYDDNNYTVSGQISSKQFEFTCNLLESFPYVFPKVIITPQTRETLPNIPHVNSDLSLCLFDSEKDIPNFDAPLCLIEATIRKAYDVLQNGINNKNEEDFYDEFNAYWTKNVKLTFFSDVEFHNSVINLKVYIGEMGNYISSDINNCIRLAKARYESPKRSDIHDCIYIPLKEPCYQETMITQRDFQYIMRKKSIYYSEYAKFLQRRKAEKSLIIFSQPKDDGYIISGFLHKRINMVHGFRKGKTPLGVALAGKDGLERVERINIVDVSQKRLFFRGGTGNSFFNKSVGMVGCGSLGSNLAETLLNCGCYKFSLYDNQILTADNIARHVCGFSNIGLNKTEALKNKLVHHNPNTLVKTFEDDIHDVLNTTPEILNNDDCLILTVANTPIEYRFAEQKLKGEINIPVIIMWVEPYALAAHALVLNKPQNVYKELFTRDYIFLNSIVLNGEKYYKREAGCQSTFMPYSGLDVKDFTISFSKFFTSDKCESSKNYHFMWTGDIANYEKYNVELVPKAYELESYKSYIERID